MKRKKPWNGGVVRRRWKGTERRGTKVKVKVRLKVKSILKYYLIFLIFLLKGILVNVLLVWGGRRNHGGAGRSCPIAFAVGLNYFEITII